MKKMDKSKNLNLRLTAEMKSKIFERSLQLGKETSEYIRDLIARDLNSLDMSENEQPRMQEFAQKIAKEFAEYLASQRTDVLGKIKESTEKNTAVLCWLYRQELTILSNLALRMNAVGTLKEETIKMVNNESANIVNKSYGKFLEKVLNNDAKTIIELLKEPI